MKFDWRLGNSDKKPEKLVYLYISDDIIYKHYHSRDHVEEN